MMRLPSLEPEFVEFIPEQILEGKLYVSMNYATAAHMCCCGCRMKVVTPLSPMDWRLTFDGEGISLYPSIGNWGFDCQSHYWIENNRVIWDRRWSRAEIEGARADDRRKKEAHYNAGSVARSSPVPAPRTGLLEWLRSWIRR